jgi:hypothetical protein
VTTKLIWEDIIKKRHKDVMWDCGLDLTGLG